MMDLFNGALTLNQAMLRQLRESPDVVRQGMLVVLLVGLLVGGVEGILLALSISDPSRVVADITALYDDLVQQFGLSATTPEARDVVRFMDENREGIIALVRDLATLPTPLPPPVGGLLQGIGLMAGRPLIYLSGVLLAVIFSHIAARQLGGQGTIQQMLGMGALSAAPHALDALGFIPFLGSALGLIAWFWGLAILITATSVAHRLDSGRAALAVLLYPTILGFLGLLGCCGLFLMLVALGAA